MGRIDYDELKKLEVLLEDEVINQEEYNAKIAQLCSVSLNNNQEPTETLEQGKRSPFTIILAIVACALLVGCIHLYSQIGELQGEVSRYSNNNSKLTQKVNELNSYKNAAITYMDRAVFVIQGDNTYYHRYNCSTFPVQFTYWAYNVEAARDRGFRECPTCFSLDNDTFIKVRF